MLHRIIGLEGTSWVMWSSPLHKFWQATPKLSVTNAYPASTSQPFFIQLAFQPFDNFSLSPLDFFISFLKCTVQNCIQYSRLGEGNLFGRHELTLHPATSATLIPFPYQGTLCFLLSSLCSLPDMMLCFLLPALSPPVLPVSSWICSMPPTKAASVTCGTCSAG